MTLQANRDAFLKTVRQAVADGNQVGVSHELQQRTRIGYQGAGTDPVARFKETFAVAGGQTHIVRSSAEAASKILELLRHVQAKHVLLGQSPMLQKLDLESRLSGTGMEIWAGKAGDSPSRIKETFFRADVGITGVDGLIAETGTIIQKSQPGQARSLSLLPPVHIAVADRTQIFPDLYDAFDAFQFENRKSKIENACITLITGPSKTGDIELRLVTGVHGPGEVHVILLDG